MKIKAKKLVGRKLIVPVDGLIDIDEFGIAEVSEEAASFLVESTKDWEIVNEEKGVEKPGKEKVEEDETIAAFKAMKPEELVEFVKEAGYPEADWKKFEEKPKLLAGYLIAEYKKTLN